MVIHRHVAIISLVLVGIAVAPSVRAEGVTVYGVGLKSCSSYLDARETGNANPDEVAFIDWLGGYFSGANTTSTHRNNTLGLSDLQGAMYWLDEYCRARPRVHFVEAVHMMLLGAKPGPAAHTMETSTYGSADKSCRLFVEARGQQELSYSIEFTDWLGGYLSGVNGISLSTSNVLGGMKLAGALRWLEGYCNDHPVTSFSTAVEALIGASHHEGPETNPSVAASR